MKKLLFKLFPSYFSICQHTTIDYENLPKPENPLSLVLVDEENEDTIRVLGMNEEREDFLYKEVKKAVIDNECKIAVLQQMTPHLKHINEFYVVTLMIQRETSMLGSPLGGLIQSFMEHRRRNDQSPDGDDN